jgi:hypothetical protein
MSRHYRNSIRADLERRIARGGRDAAALGATLEQLDALNSTDPTAPT